VESTGLQKPENLLLLGLSEEQIPRPSGRRARRAARLGTTKFRGI
jgi:hypothetical protein